MGAGPWVKCYAPRRARSGARQAQNPARADSERQANGVSVEFALARRRAASVHAFATVTK
jgi:hypothetical protein